MKRADFRSFVEKRISDFPRYQYENDIESALEEMEDKIDVVRDFLKAMLEEAEKTPDASLGYINRLGRAIDTMQTAKCECYETYDEQDA